MKKLITLVLFLIPHIGFSQSTISQAFSKEITELRLIKHLIDEMQVSGSDLYTGELEVFTADVSGDLSTAYYSFQDTSHFVLAFYNYRWNEYGNTYQEYSFKTMDISSAKSFLNIAESLYANYAGDYSGNKILQKDQYVIGKIAGLKVFINESKQLFVYWPEKDLIANWKITNLKRAKRRLERTLE